MEVKEEERESQNEGEVQEDDQQLQESIIPSAENSDGVGSPDLIQIPEIDFNELVFLSALGRGTYGMVNKMSFRGKQVAVKIIETPMERKALSSEVNQAFFSFLNVLLQIPCRGRDKTKAGIRLHLGMLHTCMRRGVAPQVPRRIQPILMYDVVYLH